MKNGEDELIFFVALDETLHLYYFLIDMGKCALQSKGGI
ncbi:hypothetical protein BMY_0285 [Wohlfahrtiimonas chitiniclastica]|nr:hypothetical protein BMY_0285 [Wohlfahrtiimonas chitiniclastica]